MLAGLPAALSAQTVLNLTPSSDTWVRSGTNATNYGSASELLLGTVATTNAALGADVPGADVGRILVSFNLGDPSVTSALSGLTITDVTLTFTVNSTDGSSVSNVVSYSVFNTAAYTASSVTWNNRPAPTGSAVSTVSVNPTSPGGTVTFDSSVSFTSLVTSSVGGTLNLILKQTTESSPASRELLRLRSVDFAGTSSDPVLSITAISTIPEPSAFAALFGLFALGFSATRRRRA